MCAFVCVYMLSLYLQVAMAQRDALRLENQNLRHIALTREGLDINTSQAEYHFRELQKAYNTAISSLEVCLCVCVCVCVVGGCMTEREREGGRDRAISCEVAMFIYELAADNVISCCLVQWNVQNFWCYHKI